MSVPGGADVAIKPDSGSVNINAPDDTTAFDVNGGELTLGGGGGTVIVDGGESGSDAVTGDNGYKNSLITVSSGTLNISDGTQILNNKITANNSNGGGITVSSGGTVEMNDGIISGCQTDKWGGGVLVNGGTFTMEGGTISNCYAVNASSNSNAFCGGGVAVINGTFTMKNGSKITGNAARWGGGVGIRNGTFNMEGGIISNNEAKGAKGNNYWGGGGVHVAGSGSIFYLKEGRIEGNKVSASNSPGGGISITGYLSDSDTESYPTFYCESGNIGTTITIDGNTSNTGPQVYIKKDVLYANSINGSPQALTTDITTVDGLKNSQ